MSLPTTDERLLKALADAIVVHPRATLKELAEAAGVSKATLHRFCGTRDNLVNMLESYGEQVLAQVIGDAGLDAADPIAALRRLIVEHLKHREMMIFLLFQYRPDSFDDSEQNRPWRAYADALDAFFLRGQRAGALRIDISAAVFTEMFLSMVYGIVDAERRGRAASATSVQTLELLFLDGAAAPAA
ncbi:TetR/AcrR family transcriptional regulator [Pseudomonas japonica]|uniref:TetR/AcrR family transcriptional regulator n=1 Tax=Pseudomonas japonica TaxID=256466 RepID=UPI0037F1EBF4